MNVLLGICGSIAAYKSLELIRLLKKNSADVKVILKQRGAKRQITTTDDKERPNHFATYWFGQDTCLFMLGLVKKLEQRILDFMNENSL